jgi:hypothetical protein
VSHPFGSDGSPEEVVDPLVERPKAAITRHSKGRAHAQRANSEAGTSQDDATTQIRGLFHESALSWLLRSALGAFSLRTRGRPSSSKSESGRTINTRPEA